MAPFGTVWHRGTGAQCGTVFFKDFYLPQLSCSSQFEPRTEISRGNAEEEKKEEQKEKEQKQEQDYEREEEEEKEEPPLSSDVLKSGKPAVLQRPFRK